MKSLTKFVNEALFETGYAPGETIQFRPNTTDAERLGLNDNSWYVGVLTYVKIDRFEQWYGVSYQGIELGPIHSLNVKQDINQIMTNESLRQNFVNENLLPSNAQIGDDVEFYPMYRHQQEMGISGDQRDGKVVSIKFTAAKVFYSIIDDYYAKIFDDVDSSKVTKPRILSLEEAKDLKG